MAKTKIAAGSVESWLRSMPGPLSANNPHTVLKFAHSAYSESCETPVSLGEFTDNLWARGIQPHQCGKLFYLKLPGVAREFVERHQNTPTRING